MVTVLGGVILEAQNRKCQARPWQAVSPNQCKGQLVLLTVPTNRAAEGVRGAGSAHWGFLFRLGMLPPDCFQCSMKNSQCPGSNCLTPHLVNKTNCNMKDVSVSLQHSPTDLSTVSSAGLQVEHSYPSPFHSQPPRNVKQNPATSINLHSTSCKATNPHYFGRYFILKFSEIKKRSSQFGARTCTQRVVVGPAVRSKPGREPSVCLHRAPGWTLSY